MVYVSGNLEQTFLILHPWCGGGHPPICVSFAALFLLVHAAMHFGPLSTAIWWSHSPALQQFRAVPFLWLVPQPRMGSALRHLPKGTCSQFHQLSKTFSFSLGLGREPL